MVLLRFVKMNLKEGIMIKDRLQHASSYYGISDALQKGFEWLKNNDMINMPDGKHIIDG